MLACGEHRDRARFVQIVRQQHGDRVHSFGLQGCVNVSVLSWAATAVVRQGCSAELRELFEPGRVTVDLVNAPS